MNFLFVASAMILASILLGCRKNGWLMKMLNDIEETEHNLHH